MREGAPSRRSGSISVCAGPAVLILALVAAAGCTPPAASPPPLMPTVVAPPQPPEAPPVVAAPPPPLPKYAGHVASYRTKAEAEAAWPSYVQRFSVVKDEPRRYVEIDLGVQRGKVVRLLLGNFPEQSDAARFCQRLRAAGIYCAPHNIPPDAVAETIS